MSQPQEQPNEPQQPNSDLANELRELGQQIEHAFRGAMESERAKQIQRDISLGMKEIGAQVQSAVKALQDDPRVQQLADRGQQTLSQAQQSQTAKDFQETLARGVAQLNDQLAGFVTRLRSDDGDATVASTASNVPIDETPATGETTRLDETKF